MVARALTNEDVLERIRPVSRELLRGVAPEVRHLELRLVPGPEGRETDVRLEVVVVGEGVAPEVSPALAEAARQLAEAWFAVGEGLPTLVYHCDCEADGTWRTWMA